MGRATAWRASEILKWVEEYGYQKVLDQHT